MSGVALRRVEQDRERWVMPVLTTPPEFVEEISPSIPIFRFPMLHLCLSWQGVHKHIDLVLSSRASGDSKENQKGVEDMWLEPEMQSLVDHSRIWR